MDMNRFHWDIELIDSFQDELNGDELGFIGDLGGKIGDIIKQSVQGVAKSARTAAVKTAIPQDDQSTDEIDRANREVFISKVIDRMNNRFAPQLNEIDKYLYTSDAQTRATNMHNDKMKRDVFRKNVIMEMKNLSRLLPENHPVRMRINYL